MNYFQEYEVLKEARKLIPMKSEWICIERTGLFGVGATVYVHEIFSCLYFMTDLIEVNFSRYYCNPYVTSWSSRTKEEFLRHFRPSNL